MNRYKTFGLSLVVLVIGVVGFAFLGRSSLKTPDAIYLGNPTELPASIRSELPTAYRWQLEEDIRFEITDKPDDTRALFQLDEYTDKESMNEIMEWAAQNGKAEVYFFYLPPADPDKLVRFELPFDIADLFPKIEWPDLENIFLPLVTTHEALADFPVPAPELPCVNGCVPANWCIGFSWSSLDDDPNDGRTPSMNICFKFKTNQVYRDGMHQHISKNAGVFLYTFENYPASVIDCMKFHNNANYIKRPVGLTINVYHNINGPALPCQGACGCAGYPESSPSELTCRTLCHCVNGQDDCTSPLPGPAPLRSYDGIIHLVSEGCERNGGNRQWRVSRHELMHLYDFGHCHFDTNKKFLRHCIGLGTVNQACGITNDVSVPGHVWF